MILIKILVIILLIFIIFFLNKKRSFFQSETGTTAASENINSIKLIANSTDYNTINLDDAKIKMNPQYNNNDYNINIGNDILIEDSIKIHGKLIDIDKLRYIKKLPIHYQDEICLKDDDGIDCIKKEHIDIIKGVQPINIVSYPDNYRKCISSYERHFHPDWWFYGNYGLHPVYTPVDCKDGNIDTQFFIKRNDEHVHEDEQIHYHIHGIDTEMHAHNNTSSPELSNLQYFTEPEAITFDRASANIMGISNEVFNELDTDNDGKISLENVYSFTHSF